MALAGKIALITGGAKGIGWACCEALGRAGAKVLVAGARGGLQSHAHTRV